MALNVCAGCTTVFAVGLTACPHCGSTDYAEQGQDMPKITSHGGATNAAEQDTAPAAEHGPELTLPDGGTIATSATWEDESDEEEGEPSSPGTSSSPSSETSKSSSEPKSSGRRSPARTTASRSKSARTESSSAAGTAGGRTAPESAASEEE